MNCVKMSETTRHTLLNILRVNHIRIVGCLLLGFLCFLIYSKDSPGNQFLQQPPKPVPSDPDNEKDEIWSHTMMKRIKDAQESCSNLKTSLRLFRTNSNRLLWSPESHLAYCRHGKVGTTTLIKLFYDFIKEEFPDSFTAHVDAEHLFERPKNSAFRQDDYFKFTVIRHPMTRLVSAYKEKISQQYRKNFMKIVRNRYRPSTKNFTEWIKIGELAGVDVTVMPTFREFAMLVVQEIEDSVQRFFSLGPLRDIDVHWMPFYMRCNPCTFDFDGIVKMETFERDMRYVTRRVSYLLSEEIDPSNDPDRNSVLTSKRNEVLQTLKSFKGTVMNSSKGLSTSELTRKIMALLPKDEKLMLKKAFYLDFVLFGYHPNEYG